MAFFDLSEEELKVYKPVCEEPEDFDAFWERTLDETREYPLDTVFEKADFGLTNVRTYDVTFSGYCGQRIKGWLILPAANTGKLPCVVEYIGYGGGRGYPTDWLVWASAGYAHFIMDTRGQGSSWLHGDTPDPEPDGSTPHFPGFMTKGVYSPETYYYRRVFADAVRAVEAARSHTEIDGGKIALRGVSQGGGITIAAAALVSDISAIMANVPFLCHYRRATEITDKTPYLEIANFLRTHRDRIDQVFRTLSYFDGVNFAVRGKAQALFSVALMDETCPPSTVFAAYNHYSGPKDIRIWRYNFHEGGGSFQIVDEIRFLNGVTGK